MNGDFSVVAPLWQDRPGRENLEVARVASAVGFRELWIGEMATYDAFALATAIGRETELGLTVGPLAVGVRTATSMAMGVASVADLTGRQVKLAIGASSPVVVGQWHGRPWAADSNHLAETAAIARALLDGERTDHRGERAASHGFRLRLDPPGAHITVAAFGRRSLEVAGAHADRVVLNMVTPEAAKRLVTTVEEAAERAGRPRPSIAAWLVAAVDPGQAAHLQMARARVGYLAAPGYDAILTEAGFGELVAYARTRPHPRDLIEAMPPDLDRTVGLVGTAPEIERRVRAYHAAGIDEVCLVPVTADDPAGERTLTALGAMRH